VPDHVGQRLLDDSVDGGGDAGWEVTGGHVEVDLEPAATDALDQLGEMADPGGVVAVGAAEQVEEAVHVGERLAPGLLDGGERVGRDPGLGALPGAAGLESDQGERVRHRVVQVASDPLALAGDRVTRGPVGCQLRRHPAVRRDAEHPAGRPGSHDDHHVDDQVGHVDPGARQVVGEAAEQDEHEPDKAGPQPGVPAEGGEQEQQHQERRRDRGRPGQRLEGETHRGEGDAEQRRAAAQAHRGHDQQVGQRVAER
jgi:hypothetical protein